LAGATLRGLPLGLYGMVMGLTGLGLAWRAALAPAWVSEPWIALGAAVFALLVAARTIFALRAGVLFPPPTPRSDASPPA